MAAILVVDDEESIRFTVQAFLQKLGHTVLTAKNVEEALSAVKAHEFDLVFVDIMLGPRSGMEVLRDIQEKQCLCPVIMITGQPHLDSATEAVRYGAFDYLAKPVTRDILTRVSTIALEHNRVLKERNRIAVDNERYRQHLEAIFRSVQDAIITVETQSTIIDANDSVRQILGMEPSELIGGTLARSRHRLLEQCVGPVSETLEKQTIIREHRIEFTTDSGSRKVYTLACSPLLNNKIQSIGAVLVIRDVSQLDALEREVKERYSFHNIIGKSRQMQGIFALLEDLAPTDTTVLITGESGTGKELVARALHHCGPRAAGPLISINCSALSENLLESELFGHVKGAFTGAIKDKPGKIELADGGSLFLDEIGDLSPLVQLKLLRVLQEKEIERVGDSKTRKVNVRIIAATNKNLMSLILNGTFRHDLYYRLKVLEITVPPLRERREDIPLLITHFVKRFNPVFHKNVTAVSHEVLNLFMAYAWPGNIRELEHALEHAFVLCHLDVISTDHLPPEIRSQATEPQGQADSMLTTPNDRNRDRILEALRLAGGNKAKAARILGISRQTMYRSLHKFGLNV